MKMIKKCFKEENGFTLIEMALVLFVISVLLLLVIPNIGNHQGTAEETGGEALQTVVQAQVDLYIMEYNQTPSFEDLQTNGYLTANQVQRAQEQGISIGGN